MVFWCGPQAGAGFGMMWYGWIFWILILIGIFFLIWVLANQNKNKPTPEDSSKEILKKRLAKGEITKEEYHKLKKELE